MSAKTDLRKQVRDKIKALTSAQKSDLSAQLLAQVERDPHFVASKTVLLFYSLPDEVCTHDFVDRWAQRKIVLLPVVDGDDLLLRRYTSSNDLCESAFHIGAPTGDTFSNLSQIDLVLVPGVAFDDNGHRMGRGRGYYDRFLSRPEVKNAYKLGVCYPCQKVKEVPTDTHDVAMDAVIGTVE